MTTQSATKSRRPNTIKIETDGDVKLVENLLCSTRKKPSAKALRRMQGEMELDGLSDLVERKSTNPKHLVRAVRRV